MVGVQELVNQQGQKGPCLTEVNGLHTLHRLLDQRRLSQNINQFRKGLPQNKPLNCYSYQYFFSERGFKRLKQLVAYLGDILASGMNSLNEQTTGSRVPVYCTENIEKLILYLCTYRIITWISLIWVDLSITITWYIISTFYVWTDKVWILCFITYNCLPDEVLDRGFPGQLNQVSHMVNH